MLKTFVAFVCLMVLASGPTLGDSNDNKDANNPAQPQAVEHKPDRRPSATASKNTKSASEQKQEECQYSGPGWFSGFYCFFAGHDKFWVSFGTLILAAFTTILGFATVFLTGATNRLVKGADKTAERQLRAYVHVSVATMKPRGDFLDYYLEVKNFGQTPASNVKLRYMIKLCEFPPTSEPFAIPDDGPNVSSAVLPPLIGMHDAFTPQQVLGPIQKGDFLAGRKAIYVFGIITYEDVFSEPRTTEFRYMAGGNVGLHSEGALRICEEGNKAT